MAIIQVHFIITGHDTNTHGHKFVSPFLSVPISRPPLLNPNAMHMCRTPCLPLKKCRKSRKAECIARVPSEKNNRVPSSFLSLHRQLL